MTLLALLQQHNTPIPTPRESEELEAYTDFFRKGISTILRKEGVFFPFYELTLLDRYAAKQGIPRKHQPLFQIIAKMLRPNSIFVVDALRQKYPERSSAIPSPINVRRSHLWYYDKKRLLSYLDGIIDHVELKQYNALQVVLKEPYYSVLNSEKNTPDGRLAFTNPLEVHLLKGKKVT